MYYKTCFRKREERTLNIFIQGINNRLKYSDVSITCLR